MPKRILRLGFDTLTTETLFSLTRNPLHQNALEIPHEVLDKLKTTRSVLEKKVESGETIYGINTGFGYLANVKISQDKLLDLQLNIIRSHACGVGDASSPQIVRSLAIAKAHSLALGHSGVSVDALIALVKLVEKDILPIIPQQGSVGASGDLAPLAHLAMGLIGEGRVTSNGIQMSASEALKSSKLEILVPGPKDGLSLLNGTQYMTALGSEAVELSKILARSADIVSAMSLDGIRGTSRAFDRRIHLARFHPGQTLVANNLRRIFQGGDQIQDSHKSCEKVQDPYSFRCIPQVHGATRDTIAHAELVINRELNSATDNPLVFEDGDVISGGNFHGQPIAFVLDFLAIALTDLGSISERRTEKLTNPHLSGLPAFATMDHGINSGFMIPQVVAAALVSENKTLSYPASVDTIPTSAEKEDHVSMGPIAGHKLLKVIGNLANILAIELLTACQAIDLLEPMKPAEPLVQLFSAVRDFSPRLENDRPLSEDIKQLSEWILSGSLLECVTNTGVIVQ